MSRINQDTAKPYVGFAVMGTDGQPVEGLTHSDFSSAAIVRDSLADTSLTLSAADADATVHAAGMVREVGGGYYKVGVATATISSYLGAIQFKATYASGTVLPLANSVVEPERGTDGANTTTPNTTTPLDAAGVRTAVGLASANLDTQLAALPTNAPLDAAGIRTAVGLATGNLDTQLSAIPTTTLDAAGVRTAVGLASANLDTQLSAIPTTAPLDAAGTRAALGMSAANLDTQLTTIDTELGQVLDRTGYALTIYAGAISNAANAAELYTLTLDSTDYTVQYAGMDSSGNRGTTTLSKA